MLLLLEALGQRDIPVRLQVSQGANQVAVPVFGSSGNAMCGSKPDRTFAARINQACCFAATTGHKGGPSSSHTGMSVLEGTWVTKANYFNRGRTSGWWASSLKEAWSPLTLRLMFVHIQGLAPLQ